MPLITEVVRVHKDVISTPKRCDEPVATNVIESNDRPFFHHIPPTTNNHQR